MTNLFYWGILCIYGISAGDSTKNFPRCGPSAVSVNCGLWTGTITLSVVVRLNLCFIYIASDTGMMFSIIVSFSIQGEMNLPAYLHPLAIKPYFNEKMNIWTLHFSQQYIISGSCAFYSLLLWLKQLQWQQPGSSPSVQLFHRRQNEIDVSKDRPVLFWVLSFSWDHANKQKKNTSFLPLSFMSQNTLSGTSTISSYLFLQIHIHPLSFFFILLSFFYHTHKKKLALS